MSRMRVIGPGRAGGAMSLALAEVGWTVDEPLHRGDPLACAADGVDLVLITTPDALIGETARLVRPDPGTVVCHLAGSLGLEVLEPHVRRAALHPLVALPNAVTGAERLRAGGWFAVAGDDLAAELAASLGGRYFEIADEHRAAYHAAACIASNHLVGLLGQAERVAGHAGVPFDAYLDLVRATVENVAELGPAGALTGPAARGDWATIDRHRQAISADERAAYDALVDAARRLVGEVESVGSVDGDRAVDGG